jgi:hypothetical protein
MKKEREREREREGETSRAAIQNSIDGLDGRRTKRERERVKNRKECCSEAKGEIKLNKQIMR